MSIPARAYVVLMQRDMVSYFLLYTRREDADEFPLCRFIQPRKCAQQGTKIKISENIQ